MPEKAKSTGKTEKPVSPAAKKPAGQKTAAAGPKSSSAKPAGRASKKTAEKRLAKVPAEYVFYCCDGAVYRDIAELAAGLANMTDDAFAYHSNLVKQDFSNWVRDIIEDIELADDLAMAANRIQAADCVADRIVLLSEEYE
jgi:hypothetical protein